MIHCIYMEL